MRKGMLMGLLLAMLATTGCIMIGNKGNQGGQVSPDGRDLVIGQNGGGIVLKSPDGRNFRITVGNDGQLVTQPAP